MAANPLHTDKGNSARPHRGKCQGSTRRLL